MSLANIYQTLCQGLGIGPVNGSYVQALGDYFNVPDVAGRRYEDEVLVAALINSGGPGTASVEIYDTFGDFPATGNDDTLYVAKDSNTIYRWDSLLNNYVVLNDNSTPSTGDTGTVYYVDVATVAALPTSTYNNGTAGIGATITRTGNGALPVLDGITLVVGNSVLVKNQTSQLQNGIYEVTAVGSAGAPWVLTRRDDYDETDEVYPSTVLPLRGTTNGNKYFNQIRTNPVIGTGSLVFSQAPAPTNTNVQTLYIDTVADTNIDGTYANGTNTSFPAYQATLTGNVNGAIGTINGVPVNSTNNRILLIGQTDAKQNGSYVVVQTGNASTPFILRRIDYSDIYLNKRFRDWVVANTLSTAYGSRYNVTSPLNFVNTQIGVSVNITIEKSNTLENILAMGGYRTGTNDIIITNHRSIGSTNFDGTPTDGYGELFLGDDSVTYNQAYLYRSADSNGNAVCGIYTDNKGVVLTDDQLISVNDRIAIYSDNNILMSIGTPSFLPNANDLIIANGSGNVGIHAETGIINLNDVGSSIAYLQLDNTLGQAYLGTSESTVLSSNGVSLTLVGGTSNEFILTTGSAGAVFDSNGVEINSGGNISLTVGDGDNIILDASATATGMIQLNADNNSITLDKTTDVVQVIAGNNLQLNAGNAIQLTSGLVSITGLQVFADNAAAQAGGIPANYLYRTATGQVMIRF